MTSRHVLRDLRNGLRRLAVETSAFGACGGGGGATSSSATYSALRSRTYATSGLRTAFRHAYATPGFSARSFAAQPLPADVKDPTGVWQYEMNTEQLSKAKHKVRAHLETQFLNQVQEATKLGQVPTHVLQGLASIGCSSSTSELRFIQANLDLLEAHDAEILEKIICLLPDKRLTALMQLLDNKARHEHLHTWLAWSRDPANAAVSATPQITRPKVLLAAQSQISDDLRSGFKSYVHIQSRLPDEVFWRRHVLTVADTDAEVASGVPAPLNKARIAECRSKMLSEVEGNADSMLRGLAELPDDAASLLLTLRRGKRQWRLVPQDWYHLGSLLVRRGDALHTYKKGERQIKEMGEVTRRNKLRMDKAEEETSATAEGVRRLCLKVLMRGKMMLQKPTIIENEVMMQLLQDSVMDLPQSDVDTLLTKWKSQPNSASPQLIDRILRHASLDTSTPPPVDRTRRYVCARLATILHDRMPHTASKWHAAAMANVAAESDERIMDLAALLSQPHALTEANLSHLVMYYVAPDKLQDALALSYMKKCRATLSALGAEQTPLELDLIADLVPTLVDKLAGPVTTVSGNSRISNELLHEIGLVLGSVPTVTLLQLQSDLQHMRRDEVIGSMRAILSVACDHHGVTESELRQTFDADTADKDGVDLLADEVDGVYSKRVAEYEEDLVRSRTPAHWMPALGIVPWEQASVPAWREGFHELAFRLYDALVANPQIDTYRDGRAVLNIGQALGIVPRNVQLPRIIVNTPDQPATEAELQTFEAEAIIAARDMSTDLWDPVLAAVRWTFERTPRTVSMSLLREFSDLEDPVDALAIAYACARLSEAKQGFVDATKVMAFPEVLDLAHHASAEKLLELNRISRPNDHRVPMSFFTKNIEQAFTMQGGDVNSAMQNCRLLGSSLDVMPSAKEAINNFADVEKERAMSLSLGNDPIAWQAMLNAQHKSDNWKLRLYETGRITHALMRLGPGLLLPDLIQNISDRPKQEAAELFTCLASMRENPTADDLQRVMSWYDDGFVSNEVIENNPMAAWQWFQDKFGDVESTDMPSVARLLTTTPPKPPTPPPSPDSTTATPSATAVVQGVPSMRPIVVDTHGKAHAVGRRKRAVARVWLSHGPGDVLVNGDAFSAAFPSSYHRAAALEPLVALWQPNEFSIRALVHGGGKSCQAQAIRLGIARALVKYVPEAQPMLKKSMLLKRDPRVVERKKPGQKKARKKRAWVKR